MSAAIATAQDGKVTTTTEMGQPETTTSKRVVNATVVSVDGNKVVAKDAAGKATEYTIPEGFKFQFQGKGIGVAELKPGMTVSATITTTTTMTPVYVTEIRTGRVVAVSGQSIIVRGPDGNRVFSNQDAEKRNAKIMRDGKQVLLIDLQAGDNFTAMIVTDAEPKVVIRSRGPGHRQRGSSSRSGPGRCSRRGPRRCPRGCSRRCPAPLPPPMPRRMPPPTLRRQPPLRRPNRRNGFRWMFWLILLLIVIVLIVWLLRRKSPDDDPLHGPPCRRPFGAGGHRFRQLKEDCGQAPPPASRRRVTNRLRKGM